MAGTVSKVTVTLILLACMADAGGSVCPEGALNFGHLARLAQLLCRKLCRTNPSFNHK
jgi:hypothetical protein